MQAPRGGLNMGSRAGEAQRAEVCACGSAGLSSNPFSVLIGTSLGGMIFPSLLAEGDGRVLSSGGTNQIAHSKSSSKLARKPPLLGYLLS